MTARWCRHPVVWFVLTKTSIVKVPRECADLVVMNSEKTSKWKMAQSERCRRNADFSPQAGGMDRQGGNIRAGTWFHPRPIIQ